MSKENRTGVYICNCGTNIAKVVNADVVCERVAKLPDVVCARSYKYMCSNPGQEMITRDIRENNLDRIVVAACSPRMHEPTFRKALEAAGVKLINQSAGVPELTPEATSESAPDPLLAAAAEAPEPGATSSPDLSPLTREQLHEALERIAWDAFSDVTEQIVKYSPEAILIIVTNPLDAMTHIAKKVSGFRKIPVIYFTQLLGIALGIDREHLDFSDNYVDPRPLLAEKSLV